MKIALLLLCLRLGAQDFAGVADFGLKKGLDLLPAVRHKFLTVTDRFTAFQAQVIPASKSTTPG
jgi:hypothetical protein